MDGKSVDILGVRIDDLSLEEAVKKVEKWLTEEQSAKRKIKHYIVTPNPEFIIAALKDLEFKKILNQADLAVPDGVGLKLSGDIENTISGTDFLEELCKLARKRGFTTGFLGGREGVAKTAAERLRKKYPKLKVVFAEDGGEVDSQGRSFKSLKLLKTDILFVAFGHIKQEKWIANNLDKIPVKITMGVGGAFDYLSGSIPRAPEWVRDLGFEWLFRLLIQPWRVKRQFALAKFAWLMLLKKIKMISCITMK